jgi:hypothetical protein
VKISRHTALFFLITNTVLIAFGIGKFFYFHETVIRDFGRPVPRLSQFNYMLVVLVPGAIIIVLYIGLHWVMRTFRERKWVRSGVIVYFVVKILNIILIAVIPLLVGRQRYLEILSLNRFLFVLSLVYLLFTLLFVRHRAIRRFFWCFTVLMALNELVAYAAPKLYDDFGYNWLLINTDITFYIPFIATLTLFVEVFNLSNLSRKQNPITDNDAESIDLTGPSGLTG